MKKLLLILVLASCQLFNKNKLSSDIQKEIKHVCLVGSGDGRVISGHSKFPFNFDMGLEEDLWLMSVQFPLRDESVVEVDILNNRYLSNFEEDLLSSTKGIDPKILRIFLKLWSKNIYSIYQAQTNNKEIKSYKVDGRKLYQTVIIKDGYKFHMEYNTLTNEDYFKWAELEVIDLKSKMKLKIQTRVRECLK